MSSEDNTLYTCSPSPGNKRTRLRTFVEEHTGRHTCPSFHCSSLSQVLRHGLINWGFNLWSRFPLPLFMGIEVLQTKPMILYPWPVRETWAVGVELHWWLSCSQWNIVVSFSVKAFFSTAVFCSQKFLSHGRENEISFIGRGESPFLTFFLLIARKKRNVCRPTQALISLSRCGRLGRYR